jgi:hypothetical protein
MSGRGRHRVARTYRGAVVRILLFVAGFVLAGGTAAVAFYVINVVDNGSAATSQAGQLQSPTSLTASADDSSGTITIGWTAGSQPDGVPVHYQVERTSGPGSPAPVCTVGSAVTSCRDTGLTAGTTYGYSIMAVLDEWQTTPITTSATTATPSLAVTLSSDSTSAGTPVTVRSIAALVGGTVDPTYNGTKSISWSGLTNSSLGQVPSYPSTSITFTDGTAALTGAGSTFTSYDAGPATLTASDAGAVAVAGSVAVTVDPAGASSFALRAPATQSAGARFDETITALDPYGNTVTDFSGAQAVSFYGPSDSPGGATPIYPASVVFNGGVGTATLTLFDAETTTLTAAQGSLTGTSSSFTVDPAGAARFALTPPASQNAGASFDETITALDSYGNTDTDFSGAQPITWSGPSESPGGTSPGYPASVTFSGGVGAAALTTFDAGTTTFTATLGTLTGTSGTFTVRPAAASSFALSTPATPTAGMNFNETITVLDPYGNTADGYASESACITFSGPSASPNATDPTYPPAGDCPAGASSVAFDASSDGSTAITVFDAQTTTLAATAGTLTGTSGTFTVSPGPASSFALSTPASSTAGLSFDETLTALDAYSNTVETYVGPQTLTWSAPSGSPDDTAPIYPASVTFTGGVGTAGITLFDVGTADLTATQGTLTGTSGTFSVSASAPPSTQTSALIVRTHHGRTKNTIPRLGTSISASLRQVLAKRFEQPHGPGRVYGHRHGEQHTMGAVQAVAGPPNLQ